MNSVSKVILYQILLHILIINPVLSLFPQEWFPIHYHNILILEILIIVSNNIEGILPNVALRPFHLSYILVPIAKLRDATNHVDVLPHWALVFYIEVLFSGWTQSHLWYLRGERGCILSGVALVGKRLVEVSFVRKVERLLDSLLGMGVEGRFKVTFLVFILYYYCWAA